MQGLGLSLDPKVGALSPLKWGISGKARNLKRVNVRSSARLFFKLFIPFSTSN